VRLVPHIAIGMAIAALAAPGAAHAATPSAGAGDEASPRSAINGGGDDVPSHEENSVRLGLPATTVDPQILDGTEQRRLDRARSRWRRDGMRDYHFRVILRCFCPPEITTPTVILVRGGRPQDAPSHLREAATVPRLLGIVQDAIEERVSGLSVRNGSRGMPRSIGIDSRRQVADDELEYVVDEFSPAKAPARAAVNASDRTFPWLEAGLTAGLALAAIGLAALAMRLLHRPAASA
jgi:hypothetical protein